MPDLPEVRVVPEKPPFTFVGVDYLDPLKLSKEDPVLRDMAVSSPV